MLHQCKKSYRRLRHPWTSLERFVISRFGGSNTAHKGYFGRIAEKYLLDGQIASLSFQFLLSFNSSSSPPPPPPSSSSSTSSTSSSSSSSLLSLLLLFVLVSSKSPFLYHFTSLSMSLLPSLDSWSCLSHSHFVHSAECFAWF